MYTLSTIIIMYYELFQIYHPGAVISAAQCERCFCPDDGGRIQCKKIPCPDLTCVDPVHDEGHCCPRCPNGRYWSCRINNSSFYFKLHTRQTLLRNW